MDDCNYFSNDRHRWNAPTLWKAAEGLLAVEMDPLALFAAIAGEKWNLTFGEFVDEARRVAAADLAYPIILTPEGHICDGWHRLAKAVVSCHKTIMAVKLPAMPTPDGEVKSQAEKTAEALNLLGRELFGCGLCGQKQGHGDGCPEVR